jgi:signal transduction histidine kinase
VKVGGYDIYTFKNPGPHETWKPVALLMIISLTTLIAIYVNIFNRTSIVYTHLFYVPIILASIWYRRLALLIAICLAILHVAINMSLDPFTYDPIVRAVFFVTVGYLASAFAESKFVFMNQSHASEAKMWGIRDELEVLVQERTEELRNANESLKKEIRAKQQIEKALRKARDQAELYVDLISHDIGNMNQAIMGYLELALELIDPRGKERELIVRPLEIIDSSSKLIGNVRKLQLAQAGKIPPEACDLGEILAGLRTDYSRVPGRDVNINYTPAKQSIVMANELLKDVFSNIVENSIKHSSGPLTINIGMAVKECGSRAYYLVSIEDNGPGIQDAQKRNVFMNFSQNNGKPMRRGIGLHLVKTLVELFNGSVWVEDRVAGDHKKGCRFVVMLPSMENNNNSRPYV